MICLGIDGGGSKTTFLLTNDRGDELFRTRTGPSNWISAGKKAASDAIREGAAQLPFTPDMICGGFGRSGRPEGKDFYQGNPPGSLSQIPQFRLKATQFIAYIGAIGLKPGVLLIAGTGSIAIGRKQDGTMIRAGGWGPAFGDEGGGFWIGGEAIRAAFRLHDRRQDTQEPDQIELIVQPRSVFAIASRHSDCMEFRKTQRSGCCRTVSRTSHYLSERADQYDFCKAAEHLHKLVSVALEKIEVEHSPISFAGSVASNNVHAKIDRPSLPATTRNSRTRSHYLGAAHRHCTAINFEPYELQNPRLFKSKSLR